MRFSDETLMAFADGELDEPTRSAVERAMRTDPALAAKVRQHMAMRSEVFRAFARTLEEPVPPRLHQVVNSAKVVQLDSVRAARKEVVETPRRWSWPEWGAIAATLAIGVLAGSLGLKGVQDETQLASMVGGNGLPTAHGKLDEALTAQLASAAPAGGNVRIGVSFIGRDGQYCRSFQMASMAGLACRSGKEWKIPVMAEGAAAGGGDYRQAASAIPPAVLEAIDARAVGPSLDAAGEQAAARRGWTR
jgi:hypothetical protein